MENNLMANTHTIPKLSDSLAEDVRVYIRRWELPSTMARELARLDRDIENQPDEAARCRFLLHELEQWRLALGETGTR